MNPLLRGAAGTLLLFAWISSARGAQVPVYTTNDAMAGSLRQAIQDAAPGDTIVFQIPTRAPGYSPFTNTFTITLTSAASLSIAKDLTIDAESSKIVIRRPSGASSGGIFQVDAGTVNLSNLTISDSAASGLILSGGRLTVRNCLFRNNRGVGVDAGGLIMQAAGTANVINCTFSNNTGSLRGAIQNIGGTLSVSNSTLAGNSHGINTSGTTRVRSTILVGNGAADAEGAFISEGYNLVGTTAGSSGFGATGDQIGITPAQANLGPLQDNGGVTMTKRPGSASPAIDQGNRGLDNQNQPIDTDQRGEPRPVDLPLPNATGGDGSDIGAVETASTQPGPTFTVTNTGEHSDGSCTNDDCTFLEAVNAANANPDANTINFASRLLGTTIKAVTPGGIPLSEPVTINGPGARNLTVNGLDAVTLFSVTGSEVSISGLTFTRGLPGAIDHPVGILTLTDCAITDNQSVNGAAGIFNGGTATLNVTRCTFGANFTGGTGGAIWNQGVLTASNCTFFANNALNGGGIFSSFSNGNSRTTLRNCTILNCFASDQGTANGSGGGGIYAEGSGMQHRLSNTLIALNGATTNPDVRGNFFSDGHNFIGRIGNSTGLTNGVNDDQVGTVASPLDPRIIGIRNNGGPTDTLALLADSAAIDAGDDALAPETDQRGYARNGSSDIGAFEVDGIAPITPTAISVVSRKTHGNAGTFDIDLLAGEPPPTECRSGGTGEIYQVIITFPDAVSVDRAFVASRGFAAAATLSVSGAEVTVNLTAVGNAQTALIMLENVSDGENMGDIFIPFPILIGDTSGNGSVSSSDVGQVKSQSGATVAGANFRTDVNANGTISASDIGQVKAASGTSLSP